MNSIVDFALLLSQLYFEEFLSFARPFLLLLFYFVFLKGEEQER